MRIGEILVFFVVNLNGDGAWFLSFRCFDVGDVLKSVGVLFTDGLHHHLVISYGSSPEIGDTSHALKVRNIGGRVALDFLFILGLVLLALYNSDNDFFVCLLRLLIFGQILGEFSDLTEHDIVALLKEGLLAFHKFGL